MGHINVNLSIFAGLLSQLISWWQTNFTCASWLAFRSGCKTKKQKMQPLLNTFATDFKTIPPDVLKVVADHATTFNHFCNHF